MGQNQSSSDVGNTSAPRTEGNGKIPVEYNESSAMQQYGTVTVKISWLGNNRRQQDRQNNHLVTGRGALFHGSSCNPANLIQAIEAANTYRPKDIALADSRAHQLFVIYSGGWHVIPSLEIFSRHSGTCIVIGDRKSQGKPYPMKLGDCFRLGSVGLVVSEMKTADGIERRLDTKHLQYLREEALAFDTEQEEACLAAMEGDDTDGEAGDEKSPVKLPASDRFVCYMCYESHDIPADQLVAPCDCKGDTRYLHVQCLQKWYQSSVCGPRAQVIRTTGNGAPACKICGAAYKTAFRNSSGRRVNLLEVDSNGPYLSMVVVTKHDTSPGLFNTKFRLNFGNNVNAAVEAPEPVGALTVGRSSTCNMILDYRTVSTMHAKLFCVNNEFFIQDSRSSNGTMAYIQAPVPLLFSKPIRIRMGRSTLHVQARRNWMASVRNCFMPIRQHSSQNSPASPQALFDIMSNSTLSGPTHTGGSVYRRRDVSPTGDLASPEAAVEGAPSLLAVPGAAGAVGPVLDDSPEMRALRPSLSHGSPSLASPPPSVMMTRQSMSEDNSNILDGLKRLSYEQKGMLGQLEMVSKTFLSDGKEEHKNDVVCDYKADSKEEDLDKKLPATFVTAQDEKVSDVPIGSSKTMDEDDNDRQESCMVKGDSTCTFAVGDLKEDKAGDSSSQSTTHVAELKKWEE